MGSPTVVGTPRGVLPPFSPPGGAGLNHTRLLKATGMQQIRFERHRGQANPFADREISHKTLYPYLLLFLSWMSQH